ncbi:MAG: glycosyltransferase family 39 protein [Candidatus Roizmanbacteria bacterium]|nr:glycosyltransferase family 39 protein [Candidatus Roizmanbacteria bacterium]
MTKKTILVLAVAMIICLALHLVRFSASPPGFNADEAAYGYNAYSILKTGKDEFGTPLPLLRLRSYGDNKLPGYMYATIPSVALLGLNEFSVRLPTIMSALLLVLVIYLLAREATNHEATARIAALLAAITPSLNMLSRHAHESVLMTLLISISAWCMLRIINQKNNLWWYSLGAVIAASFALYTYHSARIFYAVMIPTLGYMLWRSHKKTVFMVSLLVACLFIIPFTIAELSTPPSRLANLFIGTNTGVAAMQQELAIMSGKSPFSTMVFVVGNEIMNRYVSYFSPQYLAYHGDTNVRFGYQSMGPLSLIELGFAILGIYWALRNYQKRGVWVLLGIFLITPIPGALTWQEYSVIRTYTLFVPLIIFAAIGITMAVGAIKNKQKIWSYGLALILLGHIALTARTWEYFLVHYPSRALVIRTWEAGYSELASFVKQNYQTYDHFYITTDVGQSYMFLLFYLKYPPQDYQAAAQTSKPDEYGYSQVPGFDKFSFSNAAELPPQLPPGKPVIQVLTESQAKTLSDPAGLQRTELQRIVKGTETIFVIYAVSVPPKSIGYRTTTE